MQHFYCEICKVTETVSECTSMIYHRHNTALTMLSVVPESVSKPVQPKVITKSIARRVALQRKEHDTKA